MAHADQISQDLLPVIDRRVATRLRRLAGKKAFVPPGAEITLGDSFTLWMLGAENVAAAAHGDWPDLLQLARPLDRWHHQIRIDGKARAFFHSAPSRDSATSALFISPMAAGIDKAFAWIQKTVREDFLVRLLEAPAYHVVAFWIIDESKNNSQVLLINSLVKFKPGNKKLITSREFLDALHSKGHLGGVLSPGDETTRRDRPSR